MNANLVLLAKSGKQRVIELPGKVTVIGRRHNCDLRIPLESVSRRHCQLTCGDDGIVIRDLGSRNGILINGHKVKEEQTVNAGDYIQIGDVIFALQVDGQPASIKPPAPAPVSLEADDTAVTDEDDLDMAFDKLGDSTAQDGEIDFSDLDDDDEAIDLDSL
jgi:pSer/pThr/pTyr-binding forkhead associated (FHA) protein